MSETLTSVASDVAASGQELKQVKEGQEGLASQVEKLPGMLLAELAKHATAIQAESAADLHAIKQDLGDFRALLDGGGRDALQKVIGITKNFNLFQNWVIGMLGAIIVFLVTAGASALYGFATWNANLAHSINDNTASLKDLKTSGETALAALEARLGRDSDRVHTDMTGNKAKLDDAIVDMRDVGRSNKKRFDDIETSLRSIKDTTAEGFHHGAAAIFLGRIGSTNQVSPEPPVKGDLRLMFDVPVTSKKLERVADNSTGVAEFDFSDPSKNAQFLPPAVIASAVSMKHGKVVRVIIVFDSESRRDGFLKAMETSGELGVSVPFFHVGG